MNGIDFSHIPNLTKPKLSKTEELKLSSQSQFSVDQVLVHQKTGQKGIVHKIAINAFAAKTNDCWTHYATPILKILSKKTNELVNYQTLDVLSVKDWGCIDLKQDLKLSETELQLSLF